MPQEPLWMPRGSVRALLALGLVGATVVLAVFERAIAEPLATLAGVVVTFYFVKRNEVK